MLSFLPSPLKGTLAAILFALNTTFWCLLLYFFALLKIVIRHHRFQRWCTSMMARIGENWISGNSLEMAVLHKLDWDIQGLEGLRYDRSYLVCSNHQSWVDIVILQHVFNRKIPFLRFFLKQELLYVPLLGGAWWALDFPFMKRYSREFLEKNPHKRGEDLATTRRACERFRNTRISILNFLEGTRFTQAKHKQQKSPYKNLLLPKAGGLAFVLDAMGDQFDSILDVTICYPDGVVSLWGLFSGQLDRVKIRVRKLEIPADLRTGLPGGYLENESYRNRFQEWVRELWMEKDELLEKLKSEK